MSATRTPRARSAGRPDTRRGGTRRWIAGLAAVGVIAAACGNDDAADGPGDDPGDDTTVVDPSGNGDGAIVEAIPVAARATPETAPDQAAAAITSLGLDLFGATGAGDGENLTVSPASVAMALALLEPGTSGEGRDQLHELLRIDDPAEFHASMNTLQQDLESRAVEATGDEDPAELEMRITNAAFLQPGFPFEPDYLDAIGTDYGSVLYDADFARDPDAVTQQINDFVAEATNARITDLLAEGTLTAETILTLVNALYLNASWETPFNADATEDAPFTQLDGNEVTVPMMRGQGSSSAAGDGWVGATKRHVGGLSTQFILPDEGRFEEVASDLEGVFADYAAAQRAGASLDVPRFETRANVELSGALGSLGLTAVYEPGNLMGIADDERLYVSSVVHETFVAVDEEGIEAAAATAIIIEATSAPVDEPIPVTLDRPFFYRIVDDTTGTTLFLGQITDPTAGA